MKASKTNKLPWIAAISIVAVMGVIIGIFFLTKNGSLHQPQTITGKVTAISNQCNADGTCSVTLDSAKSVITGCGLRPDGSSCKSFNQATLHIGEDIEATVMRVNETTYNLECDSCTIRAVAQ